MQTAPRMLLKILDNADGASKFFEMHCITRTEILKIYQNMLK